VDVTEYNLYLMCAMGEVETCNAHSILNQFHQCFHGVTFWTCEGDQ